MRNNSGDTIRPQNAGQQKKPIFPKSDLMKIGVYYYPEQWPKAQWERDLNNIAKHGFEFTHMAEFAWAFLEPEEGKYDFEWLDQAIALASQAGLKVILCTPSVCPPAWMGEKYPEIYRVGSDGRRREHGIRADVSLANPVYNTLLDKIVIELAKRYGLDPRIMGWQLDNEPSANLDYSLSARRAFQTWLQNKYGAVESLNRVWAGSLWSIKYFSFEQVLIPNAAFNGEDKLSPHALLDFQRFSAEIQGEFLNRQADLLRRYIDPAQWITTNYTNVCAAADPRLSDRLDFHSFTIYPVAGANLLGGNSFRIGDASRMAEACDYYRAIKGSTAIMELQPGEINWAPVNPQVEPGAIHMWIMHAFGAGCSFVCTYRYRHSLRGSEMYHAGITQTDGVSLSRGGHEFVQALTEIKKLRLQYDPRAAMPEDLLRRRTSFLWSHDNLWDLEIQKQTPLWNTWNHRRKYTFAVKSAGAPMDFISENDLFTNYPFMVAPAYSLIDEELVQKWRAYVENGGSLILSCRSGQKNRDGHFFEAPWSAPIVSLIGAEIEFFDMLPAEVKGAVKAGDDLFEWNCWADILSPKEDAVVLAVYADQFYKGKAAAVTRRIGKGCVTYVGVESIDGRLERLIVRSVYERAQVTIEELPKGVFVEWRDGFFVGVNYSIEPVKLPVPTGSRILLGENPLLPARTVIWK